MMKTYYKNGQLEREGNLKNDKKEGLWRYYYENGVLEAEGYWKDGLREGLWRHYRFIFIFNK